MPHAIATPIPWRCMLAVALLAVLMSCVRHKPVIYLDREWSTTYARNTCLLFLPQGDTDPGLGACLQRQVHALESFERTLLSQFTSHPACAGIRRVNFEGDSVQLPTSGVWRLLLDLDDVEGRHEQWDLISPNTREMHHGRGNAYEMAGAICSIASGSVNTRAKHSQSKIAPTQ